MRRGWIPIEGTPPDQVEVPEEEHGECETFLQAIDEKRTASVEDEHGELRMPEVEPDQVEVPEEEHGDCETFLQGINEKLTAIIEAEHGEFRIQKERDCKTFVLAIDEK